MGINNMNVYYVPTLNRALNDMKVIKEILTSRDKIQSDYKDAKKRADVWSQNENKIVRSSDLAKKHREIQREQDLKNLKIFVEKLVLGQLNVVFCANTRRWKKSCNLFASKHLVALEKVLGSWKGLSNKILKQNGDGNMDALHKAMIVETLSSPMESITDHFPKESGSRDDEKALVIGTVGNDSMATIDVEEDTKKAAELERERKEQERKER